MWVSHPKSRTLNIQPQPAEQFGRVIQTKASAFEQLQLVVEPFDETAGMPTLEIVENPLPPMVQGVEELIKTIQAGRLDLLGPALESGLGGGPIRAMLEDRRQQGAQYIGAGQRGRQLEQLHQSALLIGIERPPFPAEQGPQLGGGNRSLGGPLGIEPAAFGLAQRVHRLPVANGDMEPIHHDLGVGQCRRHRAGVAFPPIHADPPHRGFQGVRYRLQKGLDRGPQPVGQHRQHMVVPLGVPQSRPPPRNGHGP